MTNWDPTLEQWVGSRKTIHPDGEISRQLEWFDTKEEADSFMSVIDLRVSDSFLSVNDLREKRLD